MKVSNNNQPASAAPTPPSTTANPSAVDPSKSPPNFSRPPPPLPASSTSSSSSSSSSLFSEQVGHVLELFEAWNDCERSVSLFAVLKRIPYSCAKFLQSAVEASLASKRTACERSRQLEANANSAEFVRALHDCYRSLDAAENRSNGRSAGSSSSASSTCSGGRTPNDAEDGTESTQQMRRRRRSHNDNADDDWPTTTGRQQAAGVNLPALGSYANKEQVLTDVLALMPVLTPGNAAAKLAYVELIPAAVEDAIRGTFNTELVQQLFSYVLIHPAFGADDRRSLNKVLKHLEHHIASTDPSFALFAGARSPVPSDARGASLVPPLRSSSSASGSLTHNSSSATLSSGSVSQPQPSSSSSAAAANSWQAIAPPPMSMPTASKSSEAIHLSWDGSPSMQSHRSQQQQQHLHHHHQTTPIPQHLQPSHHHHHHHNQLQHQHHQQQQHHRTLNGIASTHKAASNPSSLNRTDYHHSPAVAPSAAALFVPVDAGAVVVPSTAGDAHNSSGHQLDDHHISFSKNGTEILDFDADDTDKSNTQIGFDTGLATLTEFLAVPANGPGAATDPGDSASILDNVTLKTRRSNSLTTAAAAGCRLGGIGTPAACPSTALNAPAHYSLSAGGCPSLSSMGGLSADGGSANNLSVGAALQLQHSKPRSFSLSMAAGTRGSLLLSAGGGAGGSDTRLDDFRTVMQQQHQQLDAQQQQQQQQLQQACGPFGRIAAGGFPKSSSAYGSLLGSGDASATSAPVAPVHHVGMSNIGQWLKSLRLHKYVWLFSNISYEQMLAISEDYLQQLNVTKGARHKLVVCIQRLKERHALLTQLEKDLLHSRITLAGALDELSGIVLTPMRPVEPYNKLDVGAQFVRVLNCVSNVVIGKHINAQDEECVNTLLWILDRAVHNEAFVAHTNQLKEHRYKVARIKTTFPPKAHFVTTPAAAVAIAATGQGPPGDLATSGNGNGESTAVCAMSRSRFHYNDLTPTTTITPWRHADGTHWLPSAARRLSATATTTTLNPIQLQQQHQHHHHQHIDSDYHSMTSSQSNSTESLDKLFSTGAAAVPNFMTLDKFHFDRAISKPSPKAPFANDFLSSPLLAAMQSPDELSSSEDDAAADEEASRPTVPITRSRFVGSLIRRDEQTAAIAPPVQSQRPVLPNMSVPPPNHFAPMRRRISDNVPVFDATRPPPNFVPLSRYVAPTASTAQPSDANAPKVELYRPRELRVSQAQNIQPPSAGKLLELRPPPAMSRPPPALSGIAARFSHAPPVPAKPAESEMKPALSTPLLTISPADDAEFPSLTRKPRDRCVSESSGTPKPATESLRLADGALVYRTPECPARTSPGGPPLSLASIVRTTLPKLMDQVRNTTVQPGVVEAPAAPLNCSVDPRSGMSNVNVWLKSLRLHKYQWLFADMSYAQMLAIDDGFLERMQITKGARNKLVLSVQKLRDRSATLARIETELIGGTALMAAVLDELAMIVQSPMQPPDTSTGQANCVAGRLMKVLNMVYEKMTRKLMLMMMRPSDDLCARKLIWLLDVATHSEGLVAFQAHLRHMRQCLGNDGPKKHFGMGHHHHHQQPGGHHMQQQSAYHQHR